MKVNFYLKAANAEYETWIYCLVRHNDESVKIYTDQKIHPKFWNPETQRVRQTLKFPTNPEYNEWLNGIVTAANKIEKEWKIKHSGGQPFLQFPL